MTNPSPLENNQTNILEGPSPAIYFCPICHQDLRFSEHSYADQLPLREVAERLQAHYAYHNLEGLADESK